MPFKTDYYNLRKGGIGRREREGRGLGPYWERGGLEGERGRRGGLGPYLEASLLFVELFIGSGFK